MSEPIRRLFPRPRSEIEEYNPIMNSMPSWLPERFKTGDPYREVKMGASRLPGPGFAAINPELKNIDPESYFYFNHYSSSFFDRFIKKYKLNYWILSR